MLPSELKIKLHNWFGKYTILKQRLEGVGLAATDDERGVPLTMDVKEIDCLEEWKMSELHWGGKALGREMMSFAKVLYGKDIDGSPSLEAEECAGELRATALTALDLARLNLKLTASLETEDKQMIKRSALRRATSQCSRA